MQYDSIQKICLPFFFYWTMMNIIHVNQKDREALRMSFSYFFLLSLLVPVSCAVSQSDFPLRSIPVPLSARNCSSVFFFFFLLSRKWMSLNIGSKWGHFIVAAAHVTVMTDWEREESRAKKVPLILPSKLTERKTLLFLPLGSLFKNPGSFCFVCFWREERN